MAEITRQGPESFALQGQAPQAVQQRAGFQPTMARASTAGIANFAPDLAGLEQSSKTMDALVKLGGSFLAPRIQQAAQEQFMEGVRKASTGQALKEIIDDQPWYAEIFGPSNAGNGARFYTTQTKIAEFVGETQRRMPELAQQGPEAARQYAFNALQQFMTGDAAADQIITKELTDKFQPLFAQHAKEHYVFKQKEAYNEQQGAWAGLGDNYEAFIRSGATGTQKPEDAEAAKASLFGDLVAFPGQLPDSHEAGITEFAIAQAAKGNYHTIKALKDSGILAQIKDGSRRASVERAIGANASLRIGQEVPAVAMEIARNSLNYQQNPQEYLDAIERINEEASKRSGVPRSDAEVIPSGRVDELLTAWLRNKDNVQARAALEAAQAAEEQAKVNFAQAGLANGTAQLMIANKLTTTAHVEQAGTKDFLAAQGDPAKMADVLVRSKDYKLQAAETFFAGTLAGGSQWSPAWESAVSVFKAAGDLTAVARYTSPDQRDKLTHYAQLTAPNANGEPGIPPAVAYTIVHGPGAKAPEIKDKPVGFDELIRKAVSAKYTGWFSDDLDESSLRVVEQMVSSQFSANRASAGSDAGAVAVALVEAEKAGLQRIGNSAVWSLDPRATPLNEVINEGSGDTGRALEAVMADIAKNTLKEGKFDHYRLYRTPDRNGKAELYFEGFQKGVRIGTVITSDRLKSKARSLVDTRPTVQPDNTLGASP